MRPGHESAAGAQSVTASGGAGHDVPLRIHCLQVALNMDSREFYEEAATAAAALGVCIDIYAITPRALGLHCIDPLALNSGGAVYLYPSSEEAALPQASQSRRRGSRFLAP
jgi:Sec23/Sec24 trunk domain